ncbi:virulence protein RhuM/Fic/DOC family protein [Psychromonas antarctica]|uniref:virulence protein RhuM/Fic/DOC family protein n=1 Tax=Psychromonas antarctica TaxID=67573 RepID=UPI001EE8D4AC|nr:virulence protein RhuM/Fic/DOC family protein [Psychromonas antarctica]MCG6201393.1 virulence RhuM family protein [Psychromonas antarctica]
MTEKTEIYQTEDGALQISVMMDQESVWLSQAQMVSLLGRDKSVISRHINHVFKEGELEKQAVVAKFATTAADGKTYQVDYYHLDVIISVGYRVKSQQGTRFRQWATKTLKQHLLQGYTINQQRFDKNAKELEQALALINKALISSDISADTGKGLAEIVSRYTQTFLWLQRYDEGLLEEPNGQNGGELLTHVQAMQALNELKAQLIARGEATELFALPRGDGLSSLLGNLEQTVFGEPAYPTIESKAAHLLYFVVKNHPFSDGNKRSGAFLFVDFLHQNKRLFNENGQVVINDTGCTHLVSGRI